MKNLTLCVCFCLMLGFGFAASAQSNRPSGLDSGSIQRDIKSPFSDSASKPLPPITVAPLPKPVVQGVLFEVQSFDVRGWLVLPEALVQSTLRPWLNRTLDFSEIQKATLALEQLYQTQGWLVRVSVPPQDIENGVLQLDVVGTRLGGIELGTSGVLPMSKDRLLSFANAQMKTGEVLNLVALERAVSIIQALPGVNAQAALKAGAQPDTTDAVFSAEATAPIKGSYLLDNSGHLRTGATRASANASWNNPGDVGDQLNLTLMVTEGIRYAQWGYNVPIGYLGDRLSLSMNTMRYTLLGGLPGLVSQGTAQVRSLEWSRPWVYSRSHSLDSSIGFTDSRYSDTNGPELTRRATRATTMALTGKQFWTHGGVSSARLALVMGKVNLADSPVNLSADIAGLQTAGAYKKIAMNVSQTLAVRASSQISLMLSGQWAQKNLDSSERLPLGGVNGVRAYPSSEGSGDQAGVLNMEWRESINEKLTLNAFYDYGATRLNKYPVAGRQDTPNSYHLKGAGLGVMYMVKPGLTLTAMLAKPIGTNSGARLSEQGVRVENDSTHLNQRYWITMVATF